MNITFITEEICELLEVSKEGLKSIIKRKKLEDRLLAKGYILVDKYKDGRDNVYELKLIDDTQKWVSIQKRNRVKKEKEHDHDMYSKTRLENMNEPRIKVMQESKADIAYSTAKRFDDILIKEKVMEKEKEVYYLFNLKTKEYEKEISEDEYRNFWILNSEFKRLTKGLKYKRENYLISELQYDLLMYTTYEQFGETEDMIAVKFTTYKELEETQEILEQIKTKLGNKK